MLKGDVRAHAALYRSNQQLKQLVHTPKLRINSQIVKTPIFFKHGPRTISGGFIPTPQFLQINSSIFFCRINLE